MKLVTFEQGAQTRIGALHADNQIVDLHSACALYLRDVEGGIGVYDGGFLHVDVRITCSRWARVRGQYVGIAHLVQEPTMLAKIQTDSQSG